ncbi:hypothetical protein D3C75_1385430 [compost metagenome]
MTIWMPDREKLSPPKLRDRNGLLICSAWVSGPQIRTATSFNRMDKPKVASSVVSCLALRKG